ncbi:MAG TPA: biotin transporter BioY [Nocardioidaceae bacterium]|nr:biotin transporter BioY [Nocardioidaceae bacterium]
MSSSTPLPLYQRRPLVLADLVPASFAADVVLVVCGAALTGLVAQIAIPVAGSPVPVTGQTFGALVVGAALGWRRAAVSMGLYLLAGMAGVPWYAEHSSGMPATLGYIIGFVAAGALVGALARRGGDRRPLVTIGTMIAGNLVIYAFGLTWLMGDLHISLASAWQIGMKNYLLGDALKILLAAGCLPGAWRLVEMLRNH